jgi:predicted ester cyclase
MEKQVAEGDMVVTRWTAHGTHQGEGMDVFPSGKQIEVFEIIIARISGARSRRIAPTGARWRCCNR